MNLHKLLLTENACYKAGGTINVTGIMVHSTGANNPWLKRYVGPDDGLLGENQYNNHWNTPRPEGGQQVCVHAFIGKLADGSIATYQTLPWNHRGWHAGGAANNTHISFEICEDGLYDGTYFAKVYREAVELCAYLCKMFGLTERNVICHSEGAQQGIASNHGDVMHWFPIHGKSMDSFRVDLKKLLEGQKEQPEETEKQEPEENAPQLRDELAVGTLVAFSNAADKYNPESKAIPAWAKSDYYHIVTQTEFKGKPVIKGSKRCVLLGQMVKKAGGDVVAGVNTWTDIDYLIPVKEAEQEVAREYMVQSGDTLWWIAKKILGSGARYVEIVHLNGLKTSTIHKGQILKLPDK